MKKMKIKLILSNLLLGVTILLFVGTTIAYFTDNQKINNTLTSGNVKIALTEAEIVKDEVGNLIEDTTKPRVIGTADSTIHDYGNIYPGQTIFKDPTVQCIGTNDAWMAVKVVLSDGEGDLKKVLGLPTGGLDIARLMNGGLLKETLTTGNWNGIENAQYNDQFVLLQQEGTDEYALYFLFHNAFTTGEKVTAFEQLTIPAAWNNAEMQELCDLEIHVQAYGVQTFGFDSCYKAMTTAFPDHFNFS